VSGTDKTTPWKVADKRGDCPRECGGGYPCKHLSISRALGVYKRKQERHARTKVRAALSQGLEPEPTNHRHRALWDAT